MSSLTLQASWALAGSCTSAGVSFRRSDRLTSSFHGLQLRSPSQAGFHSCTASQKSVTQANNFDVDSASQTSSFSITSSIYDVDEASDTENPMVGWSRARAAASAAAGGGLPGAEDGDVAGAEHDHMREECGVVGVFGDEEASSLAYLALHALQHRGQEGAGIVTSDGGRMRRVTGLGLVADVFNQEKLKKLKGSAAIGHVRYATSGGSTIQNVQPFVAGYRFGSVAVAHNGNLVNHRQLRAKLEDKGSIFNTTSDTEVILHLIAMSKVRPFVSRLVAACEKLQGAYSLVFLTEDKLVAVRDPYGFRPLVMGRRANGAIVFASETCALDLIDATYEREVQPGEAIIVDSEGISSICLLPKRPRKACVFEHIYFALPNSIVFGRSVYESRYRLGQILAEESGVEADVVIPVPDSGIVSALGYSSAAGVPFQQGLIRSHYVGRTFIEPEQKIRDFGVKLKLSPVRPVLEGKRVVVIDDSIVRGTTSSKIVRLLKESGAKEVHMRITSPPITGSCYYGVDTPSKEELISWRMDIEETRRFIGADSLAFLPLHRLHDMLGEEEAPTFCDACFSGNYPVEQTDQVWEAEEMALSTAAAREEMSGAVDGAAVQGGLTRVMAAETNGASGSVEGALAR